MKNIKNGTKIISNNLTMIVTGKSQTAFLGYISYKDKAVGQISIEFSMFENPHYINNIQIIN
jgi:hypothetical protein